LRSALILRLRSLSHVLHEVVFHCQRVDSGRVSLNWTSVFVDHELGEVPLDSIDHESGLLGLEELPERMRVISVHVNFVKHVEFHAVPLCELLDLSIGAGFLVAELVTWES